MMIEEIEEKQKKHKPGPSCWCFKNRDKLVNLVSIHNKLLAGVFLDGSIQLCTFPFLRNLLYNHGLLALSSLIHHYLLYASHVLYNDEGGYIEIRRKSQYSYST